jgi:hypothetical protein
MLQPMGGPAIQEAQQIATVAVQEVQQIAGLALQEMQQFSQSVLREMQQFAQSVLREIQQFTEPAIPTSQGAGATQTYAPAPTGTSPAADPAAEINSNNPSPLAAAANSSSTVPSSTTKGKSGYVYYRYGNQSDPTTLPTPVPGLALEGGGTDIDLLYQWMAPGRMASMPRSAITTLSCPTMSPPSRQFLGAGHLEI